MITTTIEHIVKSLVEHPEQVRIVTKQEENHYTVTINVQESDLGRVIGKEGNTIRAIRAMAQLLVPDNANIVVDIANQ
jgi:predicted RNA-binding protein YlqC (UPF0109 family)